MNFHGDGVSRWLEVRDNEGRFARRHDVHGHIGAVRIAPGGRTLAYTVEASGTSELRLLELGTGATRTLLVAARLFGAPVFAPNGSSVAIVIGPAARTASVISRQTLPLEDEGQAPPETALEVISLEGKPPWHAALPATSLAWHPDARSLVVVVPRLRDGLPCSDLCRIREDAPPERIETGLVWASHPAISPSGRWLAVLGSDTTVPTPDHPSMRAWVIELGAGRTARRVSQSVTIAQRSPSADSGVVWLDDGTFAARTGKRGCIGLTQFSLNGPEKILIGGEEQVTHFARTTGGFVYATLTPTKSWSVRRCEHDAKTAVVLEPNSEFDDFLAQPEASRFELTLSGYAVGGWLLRPRQGAARRLLVSMHGGPHGFVGPGVSQTHLYRWLAASRGWTVLALDPSGSGTWGDEHLARIRGRWGVIDLDETLAAIDALKADGLVDGDQVAACGFSYGGFLAATALARTDRFRCGVIGAPVANLQTWYATSDIGTSFLGWEFEQDKPGFWHRLHDASPVHQLASVRAPTLIVQGTADRRCPQSQSTELWAGLQATRCAPSELVLYEGGTHSFPASGRPSHRIDYHERVVEFCERNLGVRT